MENSKLYGLISSLVFCLLSFLLLWFIYMPMVQKPVEEEGIMVSFGETWDGAGLGDTEAGETSEETSAPAMPSEPEVKPVSTPKPVKQQELMTQTAEKTISVPKQKDKPTTKKEPLVDLEQQQKEQQRQKAIAAALEKSRQEAKAAAEAKRQQENAKQTENLVGNAFGSGGKGSGNTSGDTRQGNPAGKGNSNGHGWSLTGRELHGSLSTPDYPDNVEGKITVRIRVNASGKVESTSIGTPTNIADAKTRSAAQNAARNARFSPGSGVSSGTITYNFSLK